MNALTQATQIVKQAQASANVANMIKERQEAYDKNIDKIHALEGMLAERRLRQQMGM